MVCHTGFLSNRYSTSSSSVAETSDRKFIDLFFIHSLSLNIIFDMAKSKKIQQLVPSDKENTVFEIKIQLKGITKPPVTRKVQVTADTNLYLLHCIIQGSMGWYNSHLHRFTSLITRREYGLPSPDDFDMDEFEDERLFTVKKVLPSVGSKLSYEYDFGDGWEHILSLEKILPREAAIRYPRLLEAKGTCPPEDCGGSWGYEALKETLSDPENDEYEEMAEWVGLEDGETWDPKEVDLDELKADTIDQYTAGLINNGELY